MLLVNADDLGRCVTATDRILGCFARGSLDSASGMVFMQDSERAAHLATAAGLDVGLHINFTETLTGASVPQALRRSHERVRRFLRRSKYALVLYNPFLRRDFREVVQEQAKEFTRLYGQPPARLDGHQHMHLSSNVLIERLLPAGTKVRRSFSFRPGEKSVLNRWYRAAVDRRLEKTHQLTDYFFALSQHMQLPRLNRVVELANSSSVELMSHPELDAEHDLLMSDEFARAIAGLGLGVCA